MKDLNSISGPQDIKGLSMEELSLLADQLREKIIETVAAKGGHLASNLGVVELTIALHSVFNTPEDRIIWDVGHQSYAHKLLTGRAKDFDSLRQYGGIAGFPKMSESRHDAFGTGHSSTSISAALGILEGRNKIGKNFKVIAVIGDGAMTAGLAFEGLNHAGHLKKDLIVILNDNEMSISKNVGALSSYLNRILTGDRFQKFKRDTKSLLESIPKVGDKVSRIAQKVEETLKGMFLPGIIFEELGFNYVGPIDGHDISRLIEVLKNIKNNTEPTLLHVITRKGKGYEFSEEDPCTFHGIGPFEAETGQKTKCSKTPSFSETFGAILTEFARRDPRIVAITAAMTEGTGLRQFAEHFPERFYDVGIAEPHAVTFAAGLATQGLRPVVAIYSTFLQRSYDEIIHDVCLQKLPVIFAIDRAGIVGEDGPTHHGVFDIAYLRHIPNLCVMAPKNSLEMRQMLSLALTLDIASAIRYPRGNVVEDMELLAADDVKMGTAEVLSEGSDIAIIGVGNMVHPAYLASKRLEKEGTHVTLINARFIKPLDRDTIMTAGRRTGRLLIVEEHAVSGGFSGAVLEAFHQAGVSGIPVKMLGLPDTFIEQGNQKELRHIYSLDETGIYDAAVSLIRESTGR
ncbi:MAG: 1-deoxy-D-xylulose-5-phosphate synthase [bacterium]